MSTYLFSKSLFAPHFLLRIRKLATYLLLQDDYLKKAKDRWVKFLCVCLLSFIILWKQDFYVLF